MSIVSAIMVPHPPLIIPTIGNGKERKTKKTIESYKNACKLISDSNPELIIIISPHVTMYTDYFHILRPDENKGDFSGFGDCSTKYVLKYDNEFIEELTKEFNKCGYLGESSTLDHGTMIPLYFLNEYVKGIKYVVIGVSCLPLIEHYKLGMKIKNVSEKLNKRVSIIASGDLSHKLLETGPYGFNKYGPIYDKEIMKIMSNSNFNKLLTIDNKTLEESANCGHPSFTIMAGALDSINIDSKKLSYEGTFGVGYGICTFIPTTKNNDRNFYDKYLLEEKTRLLKVRDNESNIVSLARKTVEYYINTGNKLLIPNNINKELINNKKAVFVTLHEYGKLRGCIGTIMPCHESLAQEVIENAIKSCSIDNRFEPVSQNELEYLEYSVDTLSDIESIESRDELDVKKYGVIVNSGYKRGLLLPNIDGIDTIEDQIKIAMKKGNISNNETITLERFEVKRFH